MGLGIGFGHRRLLFKLLRLQDTVPLETSQ